MTIRLTSQNEYTIYNSNEVSIGCIIYDHIGRNWIASINGKIVATGKLSYIVHTLVL